MPVAETWVPVGYGLLAALGFALSALLSKQGLRYAGSVSGTLVSIGASTTCCWLVAPFALSRADWQPAALAVFATIGCFRPILSANLAMAGHHRLGPTVSSTVASVSPLFAVAGGVLLLGERLTTPIALGTLSIVGGVIVLSWQSGGAGRGLGRWLRWALLFPLGAAVLRSAAHIMAKGALALVSSPLVGGLVGYTVSFALGLVLFLLRPPAGGRHVPLRGARWFAAGGLCNAAAIVFLYSALKYGPVVLVIPVTTASPLFTLVLSRLFFNVEVINRRTLAGVLLIVPGVVLISLLH